MKLSHKLGSVGILCGILLIGAALRVYNLSFPSIGYHNMQENEYMGIAHEMDRTHDYATKRIYFYNLLDSEAPERVDRQPPIVSYQTLAAWKVFGENLWAPRLINVIFGVFSILILYLIAGVLFNDRRLSLFAALAMAIMPLTVFFSRNLQPESPALFFMLLGSLFYLRFLSKPKRYDLVLGGLAFLSAWLYKFSFLIGLLPLMLCIPLKPKGKGGKKKKFAYYALSLLLPYTAIAAVVILLCWTGQLQMNNIINSKSLEIFSPSYWKESGRTIWWYTQYENFTLVFTLAAILGIAAAFFNKNKGLAERYIIGWAVAIIPYCVLFPGPIAHNSYSQMPFVPLVCLSGAYAASFISSIIKKFTKKDLLIFILIAMIALSAPFARLSIVRMHATVFPGVDVAGESLRDFTKPGERIFLLTHAQGYGIARYARRSADWSYDLEEFKDKEQSLGMRYICIYPPEFLLSLKKDRPALFNYIKDNYHVKEAGMIEEPQSLFYIILEKGKGAGTDDFMETISGSPQLKTIYRIMDKYVFFYALRPVSGEGKEKR